MTAANDPVAASCFQLGVFLCIGLLCSEVCVGSVRPCLFLRRGCEDENVVEPVGLERLSIVDTT